MSVRMHAGAHNGAGIERASAAPQMAKMPWYPRDFASATRGWSVTARGIYRELLDAQWDMGALPADPAQLRVLIGASPAEWKVWPLIEPKFPKGNDGQRRNPRLESHRQKAVDVLERQRAGAASTNRTLGRQ